MRSGLDRLQEEKTKQIEHDKWMADQKRQLMALRMRKVLAKEQPRTLKPGTSTTVYDPEAGFTIFWDYILDVAASCDRLQLTYAFYEGRVQRTGHKVIRPHECESHGPTLKRCTFAAKRSFPKMPSSLDLRLVLEVSF